MIHYLSGVTKVLFVGVYVFPQSLVLVLLDPYVPAKLVVLGFHIPDLGIESFKLFNLLRDVFFQFVVPVIHNW